MKEERFVWLGVGVLVVALAAILAVVGSVFGRAAAVREVVREVPVVITATPVPAAQVEPTAAPQGQTAAMPQLIAGGKIVEADVHIAQEAFSPANLEVAVGTLVVWFNDDPIEHTVTSQEGWFDSGPIAPGKTFAHQFNKPGTFAYGCTIHPSMKGTIVVKPGGAVAAPLFSGKPVAQFFVDTCGGCHGPHREGGTGPALVPGRLTQPDDFYFNTIKNGRPGTVMPSWGAAGLSDEEIRALVGFIKSEPKAEEVQWELDQVKGSRQVLVPDSELPDRPVHNGNIDNLMLVTEREARSIAVFDGDTNQLLGHIEASYRAHGYTFDPTNDRWAYNVGRDGWLFKIDLYSLKAVTKVKVGLDSRGLAMSDDGQFLIVGNYIPATAVILDARTLEPLKVIHTDGVDPDGNQVHSRVCITSDVSPKLAGPYFIIALKEAGQLWRIDWSKPDFPIDKVEKVGHVLHDGFLSPDNHFFYIASQKDNWMAVVDVARWQLVAKIETGKTPHPGSGAAWVADDGKTYGATVHAGEGKVTIWDLADNRIAGTIETAGPGLFIRSNDHNPYVWADALFANPGNKIYVFEKNPPFKLVKVIDEGIQTLHPEFTADAKYVYVADWQGNVVRMYDANTLEKVAEVGGVTTPTGIFSVERRVETLGH
jgi:nitrite reductase (NO-forming)/hydroxylamine reductase